MWKVVILSVFISILLGSGYVIASPIAISKEIDYVNHALREALLQHEPELALDQLEKMKEAVLAADLSKAGSIRGIRMLLEEIEHLDRELHAIRPNYINISQMGTRVYLAVDALTHKGQPAWLDVEQVMRRHLQSWRDALQAKSSGLARQQWIRVWQTWQEIEPAAWMHTAPSAMEQAHAWMQATNRAMRGKLDYARITALMRFEKPAIDGLFHHAQPTLQATTVTGASSSVDWKLPASIAAIIIGVLSAIAMYTRKKPYTARTIHPETK